MLIIHPAIRNNYLSLLCILLLLIVQTGCDRKIRSISEMPKGVWFVSEEVGLALRFVDVDGPVRGTYFPTDRAVADIGSFEARWSRSGFDFSFSGYPEKSLTGNIVMTDEGFDIITRRKSKTAFKHAPEMGLPSRPWRYSSVITTKVTRTERIYGYASGYYSSKPVDDMSAGKYPEIILSVLSDVNSNMFSDSIKLEMDIYKPAEDTVKRRPLLLLIHGGAFVIGDKRDELQRRLGIYYAQCGYVVASINYRLGYPFVPGMYSQLERCIYRGIQDVRASLRYLSAHSDIYGIDTDNVFLAGNSAGGFLSLFTAFMEEHESWASTGRSLWGLRKELGCLDCSTNEYRGDYRIAGVVNLWGGITDLALIEAHEKIPVYMVHGTADRIVPIGYEYPFNNLNRRLTAFFTRKMYGSQPICDHMKQLGFDVSLNAIPNGKHEPQNDDSSTYYDIRNEIRGFMFGVLSGKPLQISGPEIVSRNDNTAKFTVRNHNNEPIQWSCRGGLIINTRNNSVDVVWFSTSNERTLTAAATSGIGLVRSARVMVQVGEK